MALPSIGGGRQLGDGNTNEPVMGVQGTPAAKTTSTTLSVSDIAAGIITVNQGGGAASNLTTPTGTQLDAAFSNAKVDSSIDFWIINTSTVDAEDAAIVAGTGVTLVGNDDILANSATTINSSAYFRLRRTGTNAWTLYRLA